MFEFPPPRQRGLLLHGFLIVILLAVLVIALWQVFQVSVGPSFTIYVVLALGSFIGLPFLGYRAYALWKARYTLDRDNLRIEWGLRGEDVPISDVEWVRSPQDLSTPLRLPMVRMPGAILGTRRHPDLGDVEFLASDSRKLLLVATSRQVFAISPAPPARVIASRFFNFGPVGGVDHCLVAGFSSFRGTFVHNLCRACAGVFHWSSIFGIPRVRVMESPLHARPG